MRGGPRAGAPRPADRLWPPVARGAWRSWRGWHRSPGGGRGALALALAFLAAGAVQGQEAAPGVVAAEYRAPTDRYPHGVLGDDLEWGALSLTLTDGAARVYRLGPDRVFEDTAPRIVDIDLDGRFEVAVVESDAREGARLLVLDGLGREVAATPWIGTRFRWLAPVGIADLDGDGWVEVAYVDRPHLARTLRVWRLGPDGFREVARLEGLTNHRIGETDIGGGLRLCAEGIEMITASADWSRVIATRLDGDRLIPRDVGPHRGRESLRAAQRC